MIDTHAHLDALEDADGAVVRASEAGVTTVVTVGTGIDSCRAALALADQHDGVYAVLGIDPHQASSPEAKRLDELRELLAHPKAVAVGETGLDHFHRHADAHDQRALFEAQLGLADDLNLPVVVHTRDAEADTAAALEGFGGTVVLHCFSSPELRSVAVQRRYYVSFAGNVTFPKAHDLRAAAAIIDIDRILVETDSPYLAPQPVRGKPNEPSNIIHTVAVLGTVRDEIPETVAGFLTDNAKAAFRLP